MKKSLGIYLHIPFCVQKCRYCDFCSVAGADGEVMQKYAELLCRSAEDFAERARGYAVDTVYFGGGTPSLLPIRAIERVMNTLPRCFDVSADAEITLECNPATADASHLRALRALGINRISMGLQSASDAELALLGRIHTAADFSRTFSDARSAGFDNISADLMYGIPDQDMASLERSIDFLVSHGPEHISAYALSVEEGTYFERHRAELNLADDDAVSDMYLRCGEKLSTSGYYRYEISNFAREGKESRHNLRYWRGLDYIGLGVAAHSCFEGERRGNRRDIDAFLRGEDITESVCPSEPREEYIMLRLRLSEGIDVQEYRDTFGEDLSLSAAVKKYIEGGFMRLSRGRLCFTERGFLVSNAILADII